MAINLDNDIKCVSLMYIVFKVNEKIINPRYFYWLLQSNNVKEQILHYCFGTVRQTLNYKDFCKIKIPLTDIKLQNEIVSKLDFYLESINNLKKIISSQKIYLPIKNDWSVKLIGELCNTQYGYTAKTENNILMSKNNIRYIRTTDIINIFELDNNDIRYIGDEKLNKISEYKVNFEDILVTRSGSVGTSFYVSKKYEGMVFASYLVRLIILNKNLILPKFLIYFTKTDYYWTQVELLKDVLTQPNLNAEKMKMIKIPCPSLEIQKELIYKWDEEFNLLNKFKKDINFFWEKINEILTEIW